MREDGTPYYIGKGKDRRAWQSHKRSNESDMLPSDKTKIIILHENLSESRAFALEKKLILDYGRIDLGTGCLRNLTEGGEGNRKSGYKLWSEEDKKRMSEQRKGKKLGPNSVPSPLIGVPRPEEVKQKISEALKGKPLTKETRRKQSEAAKNRTKQAWTGKKRPVVTCPHCQKSGADFVMSRWHFDNCKQANPQD